MKDQINVLVTPAGSGMAIVAIKALLRDRKVRVIAADMNRLAAGLFLAHKGYIVPPIYDDLFFDEIKQIIRREKVHVILPCLDTFLLPFSKKGKEFNEIGSELILSPTKTIRICRDKWLLYENLHKSISMPRSVIPRTDQSLSSNVDVIRKNTGFPAVIKPRAGSGSKNIFIANDANELKLFLRKVPNPIIQEHVIGEEYTVDMLVNKKHEPLAIVPRRRLEVKAGISVKGAIEMNKKIIDVGRKVCNTLEFFGPVNMQVIVDEKDSDLKVTEVNPRIAGGMSLTIAAGINMPLISVYLALGKKMKIKPVQNNFYMSRYFEEITFTESSQNFEHV